MSATAITFLGNVSVSDNFKGKEKVGHVVTISDRDGSLISERVYLRTEENDDALVKAIHGVFGYGTVFQFSGFESQKDYVCVTA